MQSEAITYERLRAALTGRVIGADDQDYDEARTIFYGGFDRRPAAIARVANANDVARAVRFAAETGTELAVRGGGHSVAGHGTTEGGIVIDLAEMKALELEGDGHTAWAETGLTAGEYSTAAGEHGLATGFGDTASVGIGGITLSGGVGLLVRRFGLTIDDLLAAEIVTADGELLRIDERTDPDLFWAIRGGGGNFGVVTRFRLRPAGRHGAHGLRGGNRRRTKSHRPVSSARHAHRGHGPAHALSRDLPARAARVPPDRDVQHDVRRRDRAAGDREDARAVRDLHCDDARGADPGARWGDGPRAGRRHLLRAPDRRFMVNVAALYERPEEREVYAPWVADLAAQLQRGPVGAYVGFLGDEGEARVHDAYPKPTWDRLAEVKARYDPTNLFRLNQNVRPADS